MQFQASESSIALRVCTAGVACKKGDGVVIVLRQSREATIEERRYNGSHHMVCTHGHLTGRDVHFGKMLCDMREITFYRRGGEPPR